MWTQQLIADLRFRLKVSQEAMAREIAKLRPQVELLTARSEALTELLECAARGGHPTVAEIVKTIEAYDLQLVRKEE